MNKKRDRIFHAALCSFALLMLLLISVNIQLSTMRVAFTSQVYGASQLWAGHPGALRFTALMGDGFTFEQDLAAEVRLVYEGDGQDFMLFNGNNRLGDTLEANFTVPKRVGPAMIIATLKTPDGNEFVKVPVKVVEKGQGKGLRRLEIKRSLAKNKNGERLDFPKIGKDGQLFAYPESGLLAPRAENDIFLFSPPLEGVKEWRFADPLLVLHPDSWGVAKISHNPDIMPTYSLELEENSDGASEWRKLTMEVAPAQMMLKLDSYWAKPGQEITALLQTLRRQETVYLDVWHDHTLLYSRAIQIKDGRGNYKFRLPQEEGLYFVQIYRPFVNPGETQDGRAIFVSGRRDEAALEQLVTMLAALPGGEDPLLAFLQNSRPEIPWHKGALLEELLLSRVERSGEGMPLLLNTGEQKKAAFVQRQSYSRKQLYYAYVGTGIMLLVLLIIVAVSHVRATKKAVGTVLAECEDAEPIALIPNKAALALLVFGLILSLWAVAILLENLSWTIW